MLGDGAAAKPCAIVTMEPGDGAAAKQGAMLGEGPGDGAAAKPGAIVTMEREANGFTESCRMV